MTEVDLGFKSPGMGSECQTQGAAPGLGVP